MDNIALAFSGGGFRAASYSLGCLAYLNHIQFKGEPLLKKVTFISSASGGSITNLGYSMHIFQGRSFEEAYKFLDNILEGDDVLNAAMEALHKDSEWKGRPDKSRNLINAFSVAYDRLFKSQTFGLFSDRSQDPHIEEICVNATEFTNGLPFRFQTQHPELDHHSNGRIGNAYIYFSAAGLATAERIRLADILAASSCFPAGFEPVIFPEDFTHLQLDANELRAALSYKTNPHTPAVDPAPLVASQKTDQLDILKDKDFLKDLHIGLMDGGIDDNQAIDAFELAVERRKRDNRPPFTLFLACDVTSNFMDGYTLPLQRKTLLGALPAWFPLAFWIAGLLVLPLLFIILPTWWPGYIWILATISGMCWLPLLYWGIPALIKAIGRLFKKSRPVTNSWTIMLKKYGPRFLLLNLGALKQMLLSRIKSVLILSTDVYLKQIRRMYYNDLYARDSPYRGLIIQNAIYDLSSIANNPNPVPTAAIVAIAERARLMGTTLWFGPAEQSLKADIIMTGQFTTCYSLLRWLSRQPADTLTPDLLALQSALQADWQRFCADPSWLYAPKL